MQITFPIEINPAILAIVLAVSILVLGAFSVAFIYHWRKFGMDTPLIKMAPNVYLSVAAALSALALISYFILIS